MHFLLSDQIKESYIHKCYASQTYIYLHSWLNEIQTRDEIETLRPYHTVKSSIMQTKRDRYPAMLENHIWMDQWHVPSSRKKVPHATCNWYIKGQIR